MSSSEMENSSTGSAVFGVAALLGFEAVEGLRFTAEVFLLAVPGVFFDFGVPETVDSAVAVSVGTEAAETGSTAAASFDVFELFAIYFCFWWAKPLPEERASASGNPVWPRLSRTAQVTMKHFLFRWAITTVAVMAAAFMVNGIRYDSTASLLGAALLLGILNAFLRPILLILMAPLIILTLGLFIFVVNGFMLLIVNDLVHGFHVDHFSSAFWGAILISIVSWMLSAFFRGTDGRVHPITHHTQIREVKGRVVSSRKPGES